MCLQSILQSNSLVAIAQGSIVKNNFSLLKLLYHLLQQALIKNLNDSLMTCGLLPVSITLLTVLTKNCKHNP